MSIQLPTGYQIDGAGASWCLKKDGRVLSYESGWPRYFKSPEQAASYARMHAQGQQKERSIGRI